jgi:hypothetical protein
MRSSGKLIYLSAIFLSKFELISKTYLNKKFNVEIDKNKKLLEEKWAASTLLDQDEVTKLISKTKKNSTCHIIASGYTARDNLASINKNDYVIGFNFSALIDINFDLYFIECADKQGEVESIYSLQMDVISEAESRIQDLILKNIWEKKVNIEYYENYLKKPPDPL